MGPCIGEEAREAICKEMTFEEGWNDGGDNLT